MAYGEKYYHTYCDPYGNNFRISIMQRDYSGPTIELEGQPYPFVLNYESTEDFKFQPIIQSNADVNLVFGTGNNVDFNEFWTSDERSFKIEHHKNGSLDWTGFLIPNGFEYEFKGGLYYGSFTASDGLSTLESLLFKDDVSNTFYWLENHTFNDGEMFPFILIITLILRKLDLDIDVWTLVDIYEKTMSDRTSLSRNSDPIANAYVNIKTYINDANRDDIVYWEDVNEAWNCEKVLTNVLQLFSAKLYQENGVWKIKSVNVDSKYGFDFPKEVDNKLWYKALFTNDVIDESNPNIPFFNPYGSVYSINKDLYSTDNPLVVGSSVENVLNSGLANAGYYKLVGIDQIVFVNNNNQVGMVYAYNQPVYNWHKYNTLAVYIGGEELDDTTAIPCDSLSEHMIGSDHIMRMDEVYKQFRVNYEYTFIREGDSPLNFIQNGSFTKPYNDNSTLAAPPNWTRRRLNNTSAKFIRCRVLDLSASEKNDSGGFSNALMVGEQPPGVSDSNTYSNARIYAFLQSDTYYLDEIKQMTFTCSARYRFQVPGGKVVYPIMQGVFVSPNGDTYLLVVRDLDDKSGYGFRWQKTEYTNLDKWEDIRNGHSAFLQLDATRAENFGEQLNTQTTWYKFNVDVDAPPTGGRFYLRIFGLACNADNGDHFNVYGMKPDGGKSDLKSLSDHWTDPNGDRPRLQITGINISYIPDPSEEVPSSYYLYANGNPNYTDQREPIELFNGDTVDPKVSSSIIVPTNVSGGKNRWDTSYNDFGRSDIGLITAKSIMAQYGMPSRLLEGDFKANGLKFGTRIVLESLPNIQFVVLRGSFNYILGRLEGATIAEISSAAIAKGGVTDGDTLDPLWMHTGRVRCIQENGVNTGYTELEQVDSNFNSESYGFYRWVLGVQDLTICPINEPSKYYWGVDFASYELSNLTDYTIQFEENGVVMVSYSNPGGRYVYFLHLASLGVVSRVANEFQNNIISSFQYLADITINGYLYRVLRQDFVTSQFDSLTLTFDFN